MCVQYWPTEHGVETVFGGVGVTSVREEHLACFTIRTVSIRLLCDESMVSCFSIAVVVDVITVIAVNVIAVDVMVVVAATP
jgi:hypothetical protein